MKMRYECTHAVHDLETWLGGPQSHRDHGDERQMAASWRREQGTSFSLPLILRVAITICRCCDYELQLAATLPRLE